MAAGPPDSVALPGGERDHGSRPGAAETGERCRLQAADMRSFTVDPAEGVAGTRVVLRLEMKNEVSDCFAPLILFSFDGVALGGPSELQSNPGAGAAALIPADASVGTHVVAATAIGESAPIGEITFEVLPPAASSGVAGVFLWGPAALAAALFAVFATYWMARRRHHYGHPRLPDHPDGVCDAPRQRLAAAERAAFDAQTLAEHAVATAGAEVQGAAEEGGGELLRRYADGRDPASPRRFHLLDHDNPNAPLRSDGRLGWFYPARLAPVTAIVVHTSRAAKAATTSPTLGVADMYAKAVRPSSVHALAGPDGVVEMLPDEYTALHTEGANRASLGLEVVMCGCPAQDAAAIEHAADWVAQKAAIHAIPLRRVDRTAFVDGLSGILGHRDLVPTRDDPGEDFPWERLLDGGSPATDQPVMLDRYLLTGSSPGDGRSVALAQQVDEAMARAQGASDRVAEARDLVAAATAIVEEDRRALWACEARVPAQRILEAPDVEAPEGEDPWYLLANENRHAAMRENGKRGHYHPTRDRPIRGIVIHAGESTSAVAIADHLANVLRPASAHVAVDAEGWVNLLPDEMEAFHARHSNQQALAMVMAYTAADWGTDPLAEKATMDLAARWCGQKAREHGIPIRRITAAEWRAGEGGLIAHSDIDPGSGDDPGDGFDWDAFLAMAAGEPPAVRS